MGVGLALVTEGTEELRRELGLLATNAEMVGAKLEDVNKAYRTLYGFRDDLGANNEAMSGILNMGFKGEDIQKITEQIIGASVKFKDTLNPEGIAADMQESLAQGQTTGMFDEMLNRMGVNLDDFNAKLAEAKKNGTELDLVLQTLSNLGLTQVYDKYVEVNDVVVKNREATFDLNMQLKELGDTLQPITTKLTELSAKLVELFNMLPEWAKDVTLVFGGLLFISGPIIYTLGQIAGWLGKLKDGFVWLVDKLKWLAGLRFVTIIESLTTLAANVLPALVAGFAILWEIITAPLTLVAAAIAGLIYLGYELYKNWQGIKDLFSDIGEKLGLIEKKKDINIDTNQVDKANRDIQNLQNNIDHVENNKEITFKGSPDDLIKSLIENSGFWADLAGEQDPVFVDIEAGPMMDSIIEDFGTLDKSIKNIKFNLSKDNILSLVVDTEPIDTFSNKLGTLSEKLTELKSNTLYDFGFAFGEFIRNILTEGEKIINWFADLPGNAHKYMIEFKNNVVNESSEMLNGAIGYIKELPEKTYIYFREMIDSAIRSGRDFVNGFIESIKDLPNRFWEYLLSIIDGIINFIPNLIKEAKRMGNEFIKGFKDGLTGKEVKINVGSAASSISLPGLASGGTITSAGSVLVGEYGPEILNLPRAASVTPLDSSQGSGIDYNRLANAMIQGLTGAKFVSDINTGTVKLMVGNILRKETRI
jgi:hypothetical protein